MGEIAGRVCKKTAFEDFIKKLEGKRRDGKRGEETGGRRRGGRRAKARQRRTNKTKSRDAPDGKPDFEKHRRPTKGFFAIAVRHKESIQESISPTFRTGWSFPKKGANVSKIGPSRKTSKSWCKVDPGHPENANVSRGSALGREARMARDIRQFPCHFADVRGESA